MDENTLDSSRRGGQVSFLIVKWKKGGMEEKGREERSRGGGKGGRREVGKRERTEVGEREVGEEGRVKGGR